MNRWGLLLTLSLWSLTTPMSGQSLRPQDQAPMLADVVEVTPRGEAGRYSFAVTIASPDTGCDQYADWWEVVNSAGELLYRRILAHSHVNEQPFTRSGGPIEIESDDTVIVRAHMNPGGYGGQALIGSVDTGFEVTSDELEISDDVEAQDPLPGNCTF